MSKKTINLKAADDKSLAVHFDTGPTAPSDEFVFITRTPDMEATSVVLTRGDVCILTTFLMEMLETRGEE